MNENRKPERNWSAISAWALVALMLVGGSSYLFAAKAEITAARAQHDVDTGRLFTCMRTIGRVKLVADETQVWAKRSLAEGAEWIYVAKYAAGTQANADYLECD